MKKLLFPVLLLSAFNTLAQNYYVPHVLNIPKLPAPTWQIEWADVDLNGYADLVTANDVTHELLIYPNVNGVVDSVPLTYPADIGIFWLADWNNDGRMDIISINDYGYDMQLILNNPSGGFFSPVSFSNTPSGQIAANTIAMKDLNADNFPDIIFNRSDTTFLLLNNAGSNTLTSQGITFNINFHREVCFTDIDADGNIDAVAGMYNNDSVVVFQNTGSFNFIAVDTIAFNNGTNQFDFLYANDLTNDGTDEIIGIVDGQLYIAQKTTGFQFNQIYTNSFLYVWTSGGYADHRGLTDFADVDGNGYTDLVIGNSVYFNTNAAFTKVAISSPADFHLAYIKAVDSDNNGTMELWWHMYQYYEYGQSFVYSVEHNSGTMLYPRMRKWNVNPQITYAAYEKYVDFDNDGDRDFLYHSAGRVMLAVNDGNDNFTDITVLAPTGLNNGDVDVADVDQDGLPDILQLNGIGFNSYWITYYRNLGNHQFQSMGNIINTVYPKWPYLIAHEDLDNDGMKDFVFIYSNGIQTTEIEVVKNNTTTFTSQGIIYAASQANDIHPVHCDAGDLDHNGFIDLFVDYSSGVAGNHGRFAVLMNNGAFSFSNPVNVPFNNVDERVGLADINNDGFEDLLVSRYDNFFQTSRIKARINNGNATFGSETNVSAPFNSNTQNFFTTDVNNDGLKDVISSNNFSIALNNGSSLDAWIANGTPQFTDSDPLQLDIDGDGDIDLLNGDTHTWFDNTAVSPNKINGTVFYDVNTNAAKDAGDISMTNFPVSTNPLIAISNTDANGDFTLRMGGFTGTFAVQSKSKFNSSFTFTTTPYPDSATISAANPVDNVSIGFYAAGGIHQALLDQAISSHRCNAQARLWINTANFSPLSSALSVQLTLPPNVTYINSSVTPSSQTGNQITWNLSAAPFEEKNFWLNVTMPDFTFMSDTIHFISALVSTHLSSTVTANDTLPVVLTCAYDPNDKLTIPLSTQLSGDKLYVFDDYVEYQVRFQNTGTDTAQTVVIKDLLNAEFDLSSIEIISASSYFSFMVENNRLLTVTFNNIQLPDSGTNFTGSMGYVKFGIRLLPNTPHNLAIRNIARIYFDQNDPVYTNAVDIYRVSCPDFITPVYSSAGFCSGTNYTAYINNHGLNAEYTWSLDGTVIATNDSVQFAITHTGNNLINIHIDLGVCQYDSLRTFNVSQTAPALTLNAPADTNVCPNQYVILSTNFPSTWYVNDSLTATAASSIIAFGGDTVVATYATGFCQSHTQTILHDLFNMQNTMLIPMSQLSGSSVFECEGNTIYPAAWNNVTWQWNLDNYPSPLNDTATSISIYLDPLASSGYLDLILDTLGCHYEEFYSIIISHAPSEPLNLDTSNTIFCPGYNPQIGVLTYLDSLQFYVNGIFDTTLYGVNMSYLSLTDTGSYSAIGFNDGCAHPLQYFNVASSVAPYPFVTSANNILFTNDGTVQTWFYSSDSLSFAQIAVDDTLFTPAEGFYYLYAQNADGCFDFSPVYHFLFTGVIQLNDENVLVHYNASFNTIIISGLTPFANPQLTIFNEQGQTVYNTHASFKNQLPLLAAGIYVMMLKTEKEIYINKLIKTQ